MDHRQRAIDAHVHASYVRKPERIEPRAHDVDSLFDAELAADADEWDVCHLRTQVDHMKAIIERFETETATRDGSLARDLTACRSELASLAILMQERGRLPDLGGDNFALVAGAVAEYVLAMELAVVALNEDRKDLTFLRAEEVDDLRTTVTMLWDLMSDDQCIRFSQISPVRYASVDDLWQKWDQAQKASLGGVDDCDPDCDAEHHAPMCPRWDGHNAANCVDDPNDPNIT